MRRLFVTDAPAATFLVRILVGSVFLSEGIQKFLYPADLAAGRFAKIGIPAPEIIGPVCWRMRGSLRRAPDNRIAHPPRSHCVAHRHQRGNPLDENSGASRARLLGFLASEGAALWFLEHDA